MLFALFSAFVENKSLYASFGFVREMPVIIGFMLFGEVLSPLESVLGLGMNVLSRKFEFEAGMSCCVSFDIVLHANDHIDAFGARLGYSHALATSLIKLQIQNLSAMDADWMYSAYHYSHPILTERLGALGWQGGEKVGTGGDEKSGVNSSGEGLVKATGRPSCKKAE